MLDSACYLTARGLQDETEEAEGGEGEEPGEGEGHCCGEEGPFPAAGLVTDGKEGCYAREVEQDEYQIGEGAGWSCVLLECLLKVAGVLWLVG